MTRKTDIESRLQTAFQPTLLDVRDDSAKHAKHTAMQGIDGGETHYAVRIISEAFAGKSRVDRHRMVNDALKELFAQGLHALALDAKSPAENV